MERYNQLLVCVDRSPRDATEIAWAGCISKAAGGRQAHFLHVQSAAAVPSAVSAEHPGLVEPTEDVERDLRREVAECFDGHGDTTVAVVYTSDSVVVEVLKYAKQHDVDLIVVGREPVEHAEQSASVTLAKRLGMKSVCSVLVVPRGAPTQIDKILVPIRLSDCSANALQTAAGFADAWKASIVCAHVYQVHGGYQRIGLSYEEFAARLEEHAKTEYAELLGRVDTRGVAVSAIYKDDPHDKPAALLAEMIAEQKPGLVAVGARGRTGPAGILLGRVTEELMARSPAPVLAVKKKGECMGLFEAILTYAG